MNGHEQLVEQLSRLEEDEFVTVIEQAHRQRQRERPPLPDKPEQISRDGLAEWFANRHVQVDPGIRQVVYLPTGAAEEEIRLLEVNVLSAMPDDAPVEAIDFGIDGGTSRQYRLLVADVTPAQWERIKTGQLPLPEGWALAGNKIFGRKRSN